MVAHVEIVVKPVGGDAGQKLDALYAAYFEVQTALAADKKPPPTAADTLRMNRYIERKVLEMPEQYLWMHKRFKTRPEGEARFY